MDRPGVSINENDLAAENDVTAAHRRCRQKTQQIGWHDYDPAAQFRSENLMRDEPSLEIGREAVTIPKTLRRISCAPSSR